MNSYVCDFGFLMSRRNHAFLLVLAILVLLPALSEAAGERGDITLVNGTPYNWRLSEQHLSNMNRWQFPEVITAGSTAKVPIEFGDWGFYWNMWGDVTYELEGANLTFSLEASGYFGGTYDVTAHLGNLSTPASPQDSIDLGEWPHPVLIIAGESDKFTSNGLPDAWMHENLDKLGDLTLQRLCVPGSHDSGMSLMDGGTQFARDCNTVTQVFDIDGQLRSGVRYFDIRPMLKPSFWGVYNFVTGHWTCPSYYSCQGGYGQAIESIIDQVNDYTASNPELVVLNLPQTLNTSVGWWFAPAFTNDQWCALLDKLKRLDYLFINNNAEKDLTKLKLRDFIGNGRAAVVVVAHAGIPLDQLGCNFSPSTKGFYDPENFPVFDSYSDTDDVNWMQLDQQRKLYHKRNEPTFVLSWTLTLQGVIDNGLCGDRSILDLAAAARGPLYQNVLPRSSYKTFPNVLYIDRVESRNVAALAMAVNSKANWDTAKGYVIYKGLHTDDGIYVAHTPDSNLANGGAWRQIRMSSAINTSDTPGVVYFAGGLHVLYKGSGGDSRIYIAQPAGGNLLDGASWSAQPLNPMINTSKAPAVVVLEKPLRLPELYMLYKGSGGDANIYIARSSTGIVGNGNSWSAVRLNVGINTSEAPAVAALNDTPYMFYKGAGGDTNIYIAKPTGTDVTDVMNGPAWTAERLNPGINTSTAPGVVAHKDTLYLFYKGSGSDTNIYVARSTGDFMNGATWTYTRLNPGINTTVAPRPVVVGDSLYLFYKGSGDSYIWIAQPGIDIFNGTDWTWQPLHHSINTSVGPGAVGM